MIRSGRADVVVAGGTEAVIHPLPIAGFAAMRAMSTRNDEPGAGLPAVGQGPGRVRARRGRRHHRAGARRARRRPRRPGLRRARRRRHHLRRLRHRRSRTRAAAARPARSRTRCATPASTAADIVHVNAHATSTPVGDMAEISRDPRRARRPPGAHRDQVDDRAPARRGRRARVDRHRSSRSATASCRRRSTSTTRTTGSTWTSSRTSRADCDIPAALNNSFGFGGHNVALVFARRPPDRRCHPEDRRDHHLVTGRRRPTTVDYRDPELRLRALFDHGTLRLLAGRDDSGVLRAPRARSTARPVDRVRHRRHPDGRRDGHRGLPAHRRRDRHRGPRAGAGDRPVALRRRPAGRGRGRAATPSARSSPRWCAPPGGYRRSRWCSARPPAVPRTARR